MFHCIWPSHSLLGLAAWDQVWWQITWEGQDEVVCHALVVKHLKAALTYSADGAEPALALADPPMAPLAKLLLDHCQSMVDEDFLQLNQQLVVAHQDQVAASLGELVRENNCARELD